jgi:hypothetical protein
LRLTTYLSLVYRRRMSGAINIFPLRLYDVNRDNVTVYLSIDASHFKSYPVTSSQFKIVLNVHLSMSGFPNRPLSLKVYASKYMIVHLPHAYYKFFPSKFYILLTVHLGTIGGNNQLDALFNVYIYIYIFHFSTCSEQPSAHHQETQFYQYIICLVCRSDRHIRQSSAQSNTYEMMY